MFEDTSLHNVAELGGSGPVGSGSLGATVWQTTTLVATEFQSTYLHDVAALGGTGPVGSGSLGATVWTTIL